jgi:TonB-linked SusC/RagA family outer membrane protein
MYKIYSEHFVLPPGFTKKLVLFMKLTTLMLFLALMQVSAGTLAQKVTLSERNASLATIFEQIRNQTGYDFAYTTSAIKTARTVTIDVKDAELKEVLDSIFSGQPLNYTIENKSVVVTIKEASLLDQLSGKIKAALHISTEIGGVVTDTLGNPLVGASISIKGTHLTTHTDSKGNFSFPNMPQGKYTLVVSYIGYEKSETSINNTGKYEHLSFALRLATSPLDQVRVIAYGTDSRRFSTSSMSTVTAADIEKQPVNNPLLALQGQAPGLTINATSGIPGSQVLVQVRGQNTLNLTPANNTPKPYDQPLFIIDGVPFASQNTNVNQFASLVAAQSNGINTLPVGISPFSNINPADIESISILKDADATSIYGTQGSNGVILITTKKGKPGATTFDLTVNTSFNSIGRPVQLLNTQQYLQLRKDAFAADGITPNNNPNDYTGGYAPDLTIFDQSKYTNWQKIIYGQNTNNTDVHGSFSGGTPYDTFIISTGYNRSSYNYPGDFADQRYTLHSSMRHSSKNHRLSVDLTTDFGYDQNNSAGFGGAQDVVIQPNYPNLLGPSGNLLWNYQGVDLTSNQFYSSLQQPTHLQNYNLNTAFHMTYKIFEGLTIGVNLGYNRNITDENSQDPGAAQNPASFDFNRKANFSTNTFQTINIEPQINYYKNIGKGSLTALIGSTYKKNTSNSTYTDGSGYANDNLLESINGAPVITTGDNYNIYKYSAGFARVNYIYDSEFIINLTGRRDGSSNFGPGRQFGNFGSVGAGWIFSEEKIFKKSTSLLSYGKISGSYGTSGSDGAEAYRYQSLYKTIQNILPFQGITPSSPYNLYNPDYSWALKKSLNIALDLGFFNNHLLLNATYYRDRENNQLANYPLPIQTGFASVLGNLDATVQNKGFEFSINSTNIQTRNFSWKTNFNISFNRNKLLSFPNLASSSYASVYVIGQPTSIIYGYRYKDVNPTTGLFEFYAKDRTVTSNPAYGPASTGGDQVPITNQEVKYSGGFGNTFTYKQFNLYIFCQFSSRNAPNYLAQIYNGNQLGFQYNQPVAVLNNYWKAPGDVTQLQRLASSYSSPNAIGPALSFGQSSGIYSNDTYLRVKTVSLSYQIPPALLTKVHIKGGSVFVNGQNLLTFTNYKVGDPETPGVFTSFPIQRILAFGLNLKF